MEQKTIVTLEPKQPVCGFGAGQNKLVESMPKQVGSGKIVIKREDTGEILYQDENVITNTVK
jgi:hypothetical protein